MPRQRRRGHVVRVIVALCVPFGLAAFAVICWLITRNRESVPTDRDPARSPVPQQVVGRGFVGSEACKSCHKKQYASWRSTYHSKMTRVATPETVVGDFDDVTLECNGQVYRLNRRGDEFWVTMPDPEIEMYYLERDMNPPRNGDQPLVEKQVLMVTGSHHFQIYWVASEQHNGLRQMPWYYFIKEEKWLPGIYTMLQPHHEGQSLQAVSVGFWNGVCVKCHSVGGVPSSDPETGQFSTWAAELGIACEACHGPANEHVQRQRVQRLDDDDSIVNPAQCDPRVTSQICGQCHSAFVPADPLQFTQYGLRYRAGGDFGESHRLLRDNDVDTPESFWNDGTCRVGGDEYNGLIDSACYQRGEMTCLSCHSMHQSDDPNDQLAGGMDGDQACLQCHAELGERIEEHTHHPAASSGSRCYNCHMPYTSWALMKAIRSHRVDSPNVAASAGMGRPNACNLCHLDKTLEWSNNYLAEWYGMPRVELNSDEKQVAASLLWLLRGNAVQRVIAAWHMGWQPARQASGTIWLVPFLARTLDDPYSVVRYTAHRALQSVSAYRDFEYDFVANVEKLVDARRRALEIWRTMDNKEEGLQRPHVLHTDAGALRQDMVRRLLEQRDNRPVRIPE